jgi:hypothetical protein
LACLAVFRTAKIGLYWTYTKKIVENNALKVSKYEYFLKIPSKFRVIGFNYMEKGKKR